MLKLTPKRRVLFVRRLTPVLLALFGVFSFVFISFLNAPKTAYAATSSTVNFQARLQTNSGAIVPDGNYNVEFKLYNAKTSSGSSQGSCSGDAHCLWVENYTSTSGAGSTDVRVQVVNGYMTVQLGSINAFGSIDWTQNLWLTMNIGGTASTASWDGEMNPRLPLTAVPYAFTAGQLQTTSGTNTSTLSIQAPTGGNQNFVIQNQGAAGTYNILATPSSTSSIDTSGNVTIKALNDSGVPFQVQNAAGSSDFLKVDATTSTTTVSNFQVASGGSVNITSGTLTIGGASTTSYTTPVGSSVPTKINIPLFDPGSYGQVLALGLPSTNCTGGTNSSCTSRAISVFDARTLAHQPSIAVFSPDENQVFGLSWDGDNCTTDPNCVPVLKSSSARVGLQAGGTTSAVLYNDSTGHTSNLIIGSGSGSTGLITLQNSTNNNTVSIKSDVVSSGYTLLLPTNVGSANQCLNVSSVASQVETIGHANCILQGGNSFGTAMSLGTNDSNALNLITGGSTQATIAVGGAITFKNSTDSTNALQVQNASGASLFNINTANNVVTLGQSTNLESTGYFNNGIGGIGSFQNLLTYSEQLDNAAWTATDVTVTANDPGSNPAPDGNTTAEKLVSGTAASHTLQQTYTTSTNGNYTFSMWVKANSGTQGVSLRIDSTGATPTTGTAASFTATTTWQRFSVTQNFTGTPSNIKPTLIITSNSSTVAGWGAQLVAGSSPQVYARTTGSTVAASQGIVSNGAALFKSLTNSTTAFQIQNATDSSVFTVDTSGGNVSLGANVNLLLSGSSAHISNPQGGTLSEAFGASASVGSNYRSTAVGNSAAITGNDGTAVGYNSSANGQAVAVGSGASCSNTGCVSIGYNATSGYGDVVVGNSASVSGNESVVVGSGASTKFKGVAIGDNATVGSNNSIAIGHGATTTGSNQLVLGGSTADGAPISNVYIGSGVTDVTPNSVTLQATSADLATSNLAGASISIAGGQGTGTGNGGSINFQVAKPGTSGTSQNALSTVASISGVNGSALFENSANSTTGFQVQNASGANLLTIDTSAEKVTIGPSGGDTAGAILILGAKTGSASDPTGVNGAMYYNATLAEFRCYENGIWRSCMANARTSYHYTNEMLSDISDNSLEFNHAGNGGSGYIDGEAGHPGIAQIGTGTTTPGTVWSYAGMVGRSTLLLGNGDYWRYETVIRLSTAGGGLSNGTDRYTLQAGFDNDAATSGTDGCFFRYSDNNNSGKWQGACRSNSVESTCDTGITVAADSWYRLTVVVNSAGNSTDFQINGVSECQVTTNIPTGAGRNTRWDDDIIKNLGTSNRYIDIDYIDVQAQFGTSR